MQNEVFCSRSMIPSVSVLMVVISEYPFIKNFVIYLGGKFKMMFTIHTKGHAPTC